jgi:hypothetical protein
MSLLQGPPGFPPGGIPFEVVLIVRSVMTTIAAIALGIPIIRALSRRFIERPPVQPGLPPEVLLRLERIEQAVDSIAIEVERVSEGQRYTTRLLSEGRPSGGTGASGGSGSPGDARTSR